MSESQSRYSIISDLTTKKLNLMDARDRLDNDLLEAEQEYTMASSNVKADKEAIMINAKKLCSKVDRDVKELKFKCDNSKKGISQKKNSFNAKIKEIESALKQLEEVSKSSVPKSD